MRKLFDRDERAVSSVIGVVLMVGVTVILATVASMYAFGVVNDLNDSSPQASFEIEESDTSEIEILKQAGGPIDGDDIVVYVDGDRSGDISTGEWKSGQTRSSDVSSLSVSGDATVRIVHEPSGTILYEEERNF